ncbi:MAG: triose-phosphate isomerase, partial [Candidatus Pacebacteria bacterium]|nr:triose-phosphate isomerase [Candidatus Paceibacterota bacterium]
MKDKKIIIGNWKMVPSSLKEARAIFQNIRSTASKLRNVQTVIAAPYIYLSDLKKLVTGHRCVVGAQDVSFEKGDAHTGEISAKMIKNIGAQYVIVGHSERRAKGETDEDVAKKVTAVT